MTFRDITNDNNNIITCSSLYTLQFSCLRVW